MAYVGLNSVLKEVLFRPQLVRPFVGTWSFRVCAQGFLTGFLYGKLQGFYRDGFMTLARVAEGF